MAFETCSNYNDYLAYKEFKQEHPLLYRGINLTEICSVELITILVTRQAKFSARDVVGTLLSRIDLTQYKDAFAEGDIVCSCYCPKRADHRKLATEICKSINGAKLIHLQVFYRWFFNPFLFARYLVWSISHLKANLSSHFMMAAKLCFCKRTIDGLNDVFNGIDLTGKHFLPLLGQAYHEATLLHFFKQKGVSTYAMFHGIIGRYKMAIPLDVVLGENIVADKVLALSESQRQILIEEFGIDPSIVYVAGNPKYPSRDIVVKNEMKRCLVLGGVSAYDEALLQLLQLLEECSDKIGIKYFFKPHPTSKVIFNPVYKAIRGIQLLDSKKTLMEILSSGEFDMAITCNTTAYYECMYYGVIPLRWAKDENHNWKGLDDRFYDEASFFEKVREIRMAETIQYCGQMKEVLVSELGVGINNYNQIVNGTESNR